MHTATDWTDYAEHVRATFGASPWFDAAEPESLRTEPLAFRSPTKFERRGERLGHDVVDLYYSRNEAPAESSARGETEERAPGGNRAAAADATAAED